MDWEASMKEAVSGGDEVEAARIADAALEKGVAPGDILEKGAVPGIYEAGRLWREGTFFLPDIILAAEAFKEVFVKVEPLLKSGDIAYKGKVVIGTVQGDAHDIGKNLVIAMLRCASYEVVDLGVDVAPYAFVKAACEHEACVLGMGAYMTTTMRVMEEVIRLLDEAGLKKRLKVVVGGAAVTRAYAEWLGADGYGEDAVRAVEVIDALLGWSR